MQIVLQEPLSRKMLYDILEVDMPYDQVAGLKDNKLYFAYEELRNLNTLLEMAREYSVSDVTGSGLPWIRAATPAREAGRTRHKETCFRPMSWR